MRLTRALAATGLLVVLAAAPACSPSSSEEPKAGDTQGQESATPSASEPAEAPAPSLDPAFAMDPPGPREGPIEASDMIVIGTAAFSEDDVAAVGGIDGVRRVVQFSQAQVPIENRLVNIAAVDPSSYRNFTPANAAETQAVWDRVAGGEMAVVKTLENRLPLDANGFVKLGVKDNAPQVHVGAYAPQIPLVDAVVNEKWGAALEDQGMVLGNALLVSTLPTDPKTLRKDVQQALGGGASVQLTDVASRNGIDPAVQQSAVVVGTVSEVVGTFNYTVIGGGRIAPEPSWVASRIDTQDVPILGSVTCNVYLFPQLRAALEEIVAQGLGDEIDPNEYAGCYYPRFIAGSTTLSNHSFGLAFDINVSGNLRGTVGEIDRQVVAIFKKWGFAWGGDWSYTDPMHFEMNRLIEPR